MSVDDLSHIFPQRGAARRIVSLVPSLTEAIGERDPEALVAATDACLYPTRLRCERVGLPSAPHLERIIELDPDVVVANREENRREDVAALRAAGIPVWVTRVDTLDDAWVSLRRLFAECLAWPEPEWIGLAEQSWAPQGRAGTLVAVPILTDPVVVLGSRTFSTSLLSRLGLVNVFDDGRGRYPRVSRAEVAASAAELILVPDEPYPFTLEEAKDLFGPQARVVSGRALSSFGPGLVGARGILERSLVG